MNDMIRYDIVNINFLSKHDNMHNNDVHYAFKSLDNYKLNA